ncbi:hypothetical protein [Geminocystis sp. NIES-3709]|uniref:hypothetical protein n=1 Tax=Geminocystis sp. NIES-3709 TaxID=1617448 RepID=UPI0005FCA9AB|nr:hypothetical protein [Geminocystis sp. NIES-3709]BAQ64852.1 hypothetical protein GM3709_1617 [Geminocystis sp. NIES-3709]
MSDHETKSDSPEIDITDAIANIEFSLEKIKERHQQIILDRARKEELEQRKQEIKELQKNNTQDSLKSELHFLEQELTQIEIRLESELFKWSSLNEPFWQIVRFVGIGIIIGWFLKTYSSP